LPSWWGRNQRRVAAELAKLPDALDQLYQDAFIDTDEADDEGASGSDDSEKPP